MNGYTCLITGATDGIGKEAAIELAKKGCKRFHLIARNISLNNSFKNFLSKKYNFIDLGPHSIEKVDYTDYAS